MTTYFASSQSPLGPAPLSWALLATLGRAAPASADVEVLGRVAADPTLDLTQTHAGWSLLAAALVGWGRGQVQSLRAPAIRSLIPSAVPGEPVLRLPVNAPETAALILLHRGLDPFEHWDQVTSGATPLTLLGGMHLDVETMKCPFGLALKMGLDSVVATSLRVSSAPAAAALDTLAVDGQPLLHALLEPRPRLIAPLLAHGMDPNVRDAHGRTPLFMARTVEQVTQLCDAGADPSAVDRQGRSIEAWWQADQVPRAAQLQRALNAARPLRPKVTPPGPASSSSFAPLTGPFLQAWEGNKLAIQKLTAPDIAQLGTTSVPGFDAPISAVSCALLGALTTIESNAGKKQHMAVVKHLWRDDQAGPLEHLLLAWVQWMRPVEPDTGAFLSQAQRERRDNRNEMAKWGQETRRRSGRVIGATDQQPWMDQAWAFLEAQDPTGAVVKDATDRMLKEEAKVGKAWGEMVPVDTQGLSQVVWDWAGRCAALPALASKDQWTPFLSNWRAAAKLPLPAQVRLSNSVTDSPRHLMHVWRVILTRASQLPDTPLEQATRQVLMDKVQAWHLPNLSADEQAMAQALDAQIAVRAPIWAGQWLAVRRNQTTLAQATPERSRARPRLRH